MKPLTFILLFFALLSCQQQGRTYRLTLWKDGKFYDYKQVGQTNIGKELDSALKLEIDTAVLYDSAANTLTEINFNYHQKPEDSE